MILRAISVEFLAALREHPGFGGWVREQARRYVDIDDVAIICCISPFAVRALMRANMGEGSFAEHIEEYAKAANFGDEQWFYLPVTIDLMAEMVGVLTGMDRDGVVSSILVIGTHDRAAVSLRRNMRLFDEPAGSIALALLQLLYSRYVFGECVIQPIPTIETEGEYNN